MMDIITSVIYQNDEETVTGKEDHHTENATKEQVCTKILTHIRIQKHYDELAQMQSKFY
jgi:hypothetical protein